MKKKFKIIDAASGEKLKLGERRDQGHSMTPTFDSEHYNEDLTPKKCYECGCTTFHKKIMDTLDGYVMAFNLSCLDCGILLQFWDAGVYNAEMAWLSNGSGEFGR